MTLSLWIVTFAKHLVLLKFHDALKESWKKPSILIKLVSYFNTYYYAVHTYIQQQNACAHHEKKSRFSLNLLQVNGVY